MNTTQKLGFETLKNAFLFVMVIVVLVLRAAKHGIKNIQPEDYIAHFLKFFTFLKNVKQLPAEIKDLEGNEEGELARQIKVEFKVQNDEFLERIIENLVIGLFSVVIAIRDIIRYFDDKETKAVKG